MKEGPFGMMDKVGLDMVYDVEMVCYILSTRWNRHTSLI
jgi:hypothetical protein